MPRTVWSINDVSLDWVLTCIRDGEHDIVKLMKWLQKAREEGYDVDTLDAEQENDLKQTLGVLEMATDGIKAMIEGNNDE